MRSTHIINHISHLPRFICMASIYACGTSLCAHADGDPRAPKISLKVEYNDQQCQKKCTDDTCRETCKVVCSEKAAQFKQKLEQQFKQKLEQQFKQKLGADEIEIKTESVALFSSELSKVQSAYKKWQDDEISRHYFITAECGTSNAQEMLLASPQVFYVYIPPVADSTAIRAAALSGLIEECVLFDQVKSTGKAGCDLDPAANLKSRCLEARAQNYGVVTINPGSHRSVITIRSDSLNHSLRFEKANPEDTVELPQSIMNFQRGFQVEIETLMGRTHAQINERTATAKQDRHGAISYLWTILPTVVGIPMVGLGAYYLERDGQCYTAPAYSCAGREQWRGPALTLLTVGASHVLIPSLIRQSKAFTYLFKWNMSR